MELDNEFKNKLLRLISTYVPPNSLDVDNSKSQNILKFEDDDENDDDNEDDNLVFKLPKCRIEKKRSLTISVNADKTFSNKIINKAFTKRVDLKNILSIKNEKIFANNF